VDDAGASRRCQPQPMFREHLSILELSLTIGHIFGRIPGKRSEETRIRGCRWDAIHGVWDLLRRSVMNSAY
jgi:hypothetical protein